MATLRVYTEEEIQELLSNPYTARVTQNRVIFNLAFKKLMLENIDKPGMTLRKIFRMAGYRDELFTPRAREYFGRKVRDEAKSPGGLKEPVLPQKSGKSRKKQAVTELRELKERVMILEQQVEFLKKSQHIKSGGSLPHLGNSS